MIAPFPLFSKKTLVGILFFVVLAEGVFLSDLLSRPTENQYPEVEELVAQNLSSLQELALYFQDVALSKGAEYAFEVLKVAPVGPNIDMHLLAHTVGDILYEQEGTTGIRICTHDFRNACSHSIVIGAFFEEGEGALEKIIGACKLAPGGKGAYTMCFHGLGHGVLAYKNYELEKAVESCKNIQEMTQTKEEYIQCVGGTIMEMVGGVHDRVLWEQQSKVYFKKDDSLYPCSAKFMPEEARFMCYIYLTPHLFEAVGGSIGTPTPQDFKSAFLLCDKLLPEDLASRDACFGGFGKEFIGLVQSRDIRLAAISAMEDQQLSQIYEWCLLAPHQEGSAACVVHAMSSLFWGGENPRSIALRFCDLISAPYYRSSCFLNLIGTVSFYVQDSQYRALFCKEIAQEYQKACRVQLE